MSAHCLADEDAQITALASALMRTFVVVVVSVVAAAAVAVVFRA